MSWSIEGGRALVGDALHDTTIHVADGRIDARPAGDTKAYDAAGRLVRELFRGELPGGVHDRQWDGRDESGRSVSSGVYYAQLIVDGGEAMTRKLALIK